MPEMTLSPHAMADIRSQLQQALEAHKAGQLERAEQGYRSVLDVAPQHFDALQLLGVLLLQRGQSDEAERILRDALAVRPKDPNVLSNLAVALKNMKRFEAALQAVDRALAVAPDAIAALNNRGNILRLLGRFDEALAGLDRVLARKPDHLDAVCNRAATLASMGMLGEALAAHGDALRLRPLHGPSLQGQGDVLMRLGRRDEAVAAYRSALAHGGDKAHIEFALAALGVGERPAAAPTDYVRNLFEAFANTFDETLVSGLLYRTPELIGTLVSRAFPSGALDILDLGCGTGLSGLSLRPLARRLVGVDLASNMLAKARQRAVYDEVVCADILDDLRRREEDRFDLVVAADVFVYLGDLDDVFQECRRVVRGGGRFVFSVEAMEGDGIELRPSLRYAHSESYLRRLAGQHRFRWESSTSATLRLDNGVPIKGDIVMLG